MVIDNLAKKLVQRENILEEAIKYCKYGLSVIPVGRDKRPKILWEEFTKRCATEEEIMAWWKQFPYANIGLVTGMISGLIVVDADGEEGKNSIREYIQEDYIGCNTPNNGMHLYFTCPDEQIKNATRFMPGVDLRANGGYVVAPPSVGSNDKPYSWFSGHSLFESDLQEAPLDLLTAVTLIGGSQIKLAPDQGVVSQLFTNGRRDTDLFTTANTLFKSGMPYAAVEQIVSRLASTCNFSPKDAQVKVESAMKRAIVRERNLKSEINDFIAGTLGEFSAKDMYAFLNITNKAEKFKAQRVLKEFIDDKFIERTHTSKDGIFRRIVTEETQIDFVNISTSYVDVKWPLGVEHYVQLMPKNIVVIAGVSNAGKTAMCLDFIFRNMSKHAINYYTSEMGGTELKVRLKKFPIKLEDWKFTAFERSSNFGDIIRPDEINIIDFLEITEDFFKAGAYISQIYNKLEKGIAIICLQRNKGNELGLGGGRSIEKARLYLNLSSDQVEIVKGKNWTSESFNPNGMRRQFTLEGGWKFVPKDDWFKITY